MTTPMFDPVSELARRILHGPVARLIIATLPLDEAIELIKLGAVECARQSGANPEEVAEHFGRSSRWVYHWQSRERAPGSAFVTRVSQRPTRYAGELTANPAVEHGTSYRLMIASVELLLSAGPEGLSLVELQQALTGRGFRPASPTVLESLMGIYVAGGLVCKVATPEGSLPRWRAVRQMLDGTLLASDRLKKAEARLPGLYQQLLTYVVGAPNSEWGYVRGAMTEGAYTRFVRRMRDALHLELNQALLESDAEREIEPSLPEVPFVLNLLASIQELEKERDHG